MIYSDILIEAAAADEGLRTAYARAVGLPSAAAGLVHGEGELPPLGRYEGLVQVWPMTGDCSLRASVIYATNIADDQDFDEAGFGQRLADALGCAVYLPSDGLEPWTFACYRPDAQPLAVEVDLDALEDGVAVVRPRRTDGREA